MRKAAINNLVEALRALVREEVAQQVAALSGGSLRALRLKHGLKAEQVAERSGLTLSCVARLERGDGKRPLPSTIIAIAGALGEPTDVISNAAMAAIHMKQSKRSA